jgi:hypothetical protein
MIKNLIEFKFMYSTHSFLLLFYLICAFATEAIYYNLPCLFQPYPLPMLFVQKSIECLKNPLYIFIALNLYLKIILLIILMLSVQPLMVMLPVGSHNPNPNTPCP